MKIKTDILTKIRIRPFARTDSLDELTQLLHVAYKRLADQGFNYLASHQDSQTTKSRLEEGQCFIATFDDRLIGTVTYYSPDRTSGHEWFDQPFVAKYGQFAVEPGFQKSGIGGQLIDLVERLATADNAKEIAVDTAETASELVRYYTKRGYRFVAHAQWTTANYRSVILSKKLGGSDHEY